MSEMNTYKRTKEEEDQLGKGIGARFSDGKIRHDLIPPWPIEQIALIYSFGVRKYSENNWWGGLRWRKDVFGCILRHIWKWCRGEKNDKESGLHHLAHAAWNCIALMEYERNGIGIDDRVPYTLDLMNDEEKYKKIALWKELNSKGKDSEYNGLNIN